MDAGGIEYIYSSIIWGNNVVLPNPEIRGCTYTLYLTETSSDTSFVLRSTATKTTPTTDGDYRLRSDSNRIDTGDATNKPDSDDDILGTTRLPDIAGKGDGTDDYDKGAYEDVE